MYTDVSRSDFIGISEGLEVWDCFPAGEMSRFGSLGDVGDATWEASDSLLEVASDFRYIPGWICFRIKDLIHTLFHVLDAVVPWTAIKAMTYGASVLGVCFAESMVMRALPHSCSIQKALHQLHPVSRRRRPINKCGSYFFETWMQCMPAAAQAWQA